MAYHFRHFSDLFIAPKVPVEDDPRLDPRAQSGLYPLYEVLNLLWVESLYRKDGEVCPIRDLLFSKFPRETRQNLKVLALDKYRAPGLRQLRKRWIQAGAQILEDLTELVGILYPPSCAVALADNNQLLGLYLSYDLSRMCCDRAVRTKAL